MEGRDIFLSNLISFGEETSLALVNIFPFRFTFKKGHLSLDFQLYVRFEYGRKNKM